MIVAENADPKRIYKTLLPMADGIVKMDTIEHEGAFWLVPEWLEHIDAGWMQPARIIRMALFPHQDTRGSEMADFVVNNPIPPEILSGKLRTLAGVEVCIEQPKIRLPIPPVLH